MIAGIVIAVILVYQLFFRYQYIERSYGITRIDRLSGTSCRLPCTPTPATPEPTPFRPETEDAAAIELAKAASGASYLESLHPDYEWYVIEITNSTADRVYSYYDPEKKQFTTTPDPESTDDYRDIRTRLICLCNKKAWGYHWEVDMQNSAVYRVEGNGTLEAKWGFTTSATTKPK